ncbi:unnamed protein product [Protopolystoma xenopodis]|uniref:Uncharacterized protein n=1 Tax=Protopolystoma xenopodis TaxID=117903 RepID=A0A3S5AE11_9PLAT|nr:unnamed protein product [Protopolystoma xenopodis]
MGIHAQKAIRESALTFPSAKLPYTLQVVGTRGLKAAAPINMPLFGPTSRKAIASSARLAGLETALTSANASDRGSDSP